MSVAIAGNAPATFEIKSANLPLVALRLKSTDLDALAAELSRQYGDIPDFFDNDPLVVDLSPLPADAPGPDFAALIALLRFHRLAALASRLPPRWRPAWSARPTRQRSKPPPPRSRPSARARQQRRQSPHWQARSFPPWSSTSRCAPASKSMREDVIWW